VYWKVLQTSREKTLEAVVFKPIDGLSQCRIQNEFNIADRLEYEEILSMEKHTLNHTEYRYEEPGFGLFEVPISSKSYFGV
jgi:hypothetical protein